MYKIGIGMIGTRILLRKGKCLDEIGVGNEVRDLLEIRYIHNSKFINKTNEMKEAFGTLTPSFPFVYYARYTKRDKVRGKGA